MIIIQLTMNQTNKQIESRIPLWIAATRVVAIPPSPQKTYEDRHPTPEYDDG